MFSGAQRPRLLTRAICLYIDPHTVPVDPDIRFAEAELQPRFLFEDAGLWETVRRFHASGLVAEKMLLRSWHASRYVTDIERAALIKLKPRSRHWSGARRPQHADGASPRNNRAHHAAADRASAGV